MRAGALAAERLELAAWLGHEAGARATGLELDPGSGLPRAAREERHGPPGWDDARAWLVGLDRFGPEGARRVAVALAGRQLSALQPRTDVTAIAALARWEAAVDYASRPADAEVGRRLATVVRRTTPQDRRVDAHFAAISASVEPLVAEAVGRSRLLARSCWPWNRLRSLATPEEVAREIEANRRALVEEVAPWALGTADRLVDLVAGRAPRPEERMARCPLAWEELEATADERVRRCAACNVDVVDSIGPGGGEADALLAASPGGSCATFRVRSDGRRQGRACLETLQAPFTMLRCGWGANAATARRPITPRERRASERNAAARRRGPHPRDVAEFLGEPYEHERRRRPPR